MQESREKKWIFEGYIAESIWQHLHDDRKILLALYHSEVIELHKQGILAETYIHFELTTIKQLLKHPANACILINTVKIPIKELDTMLDTKLEFLLTNAQNFESLTREGKIPFQTLLDLDLNVLQGLVDHKTDIIALKNQGLTIECIVNARKQFLDMESLPEGFSSLDLINMGEQLGAGQSQPVSGIPGMVTPSATPSAHLASQLAAVGIPNTLAQQMQHQIASKAMANQSLPALPELDTRTPPAPPNNLPNAKAPAAKLDPLWITLGVLHIIFALAALITVCTLGLLPTGGLSLGFAIAGTVAFMCLGARMIYAGSKPSVADSPTLFKNSTDTLEPRGPESNVGWALAQQPVGL